MAGWRVTWSDLGLTALLLLVGLVGTEPAAANQGLPAPALSYVLVVAACLPVLVWRWRPAWTFALTGAATLLYLGLGYAYGPILFALVVAVFGLALRAPVRQTVLATALLLAAGLVTIGAGIVAGERDWSELLSVTAWLVVPAAVGVAVKVRRDAAAAVRAEQGRRAVSEERLQLAREVHDVVGHGLAVIAMQAGVALRLLDRDAARTRASLEAIRATSTEALADLRAELAALRGGPGASQVPRHPGGELADVPELAARIRSGGLPVTTEVDPGAQAVPAEIGRAAYRIVQESLTNVLRHAGPDATATVRIARAPGQLWVEVHDTGRGGPASPAAGQGIDGMRARAEALGGSLAAGPQPGGGFTVQARLPAGADLVKGDPGGDPGGDPARGGGA